MDDYLRELLPRILDGQTPDEILYGLTPMQKGHTGEAILRILVLLGIHPTNPSSSVIPCMVVPSTRRIEAITDFSTILDILENGRVNSGGSNKIDVCWKDGESIVVCSSKIGMKEIKALDELEIPVMLTEFTESGGYTEEGKPVARESVIPYVLVPSKNEVYHVAKQSKSSTRVSKDNLNPLDTTDLTRMCAWLCKKTKKCWSSSSSIRSVLEHLTGHHKPLMMLRFHQFLITNKVRELIAKGKKTILIGCLPRSGKTWMGAYVAQNYSKVLVITTRPTETKNQWMKVFQHHDEFSDYKVDNLTAETTKSISDLHRVKDAKLVAIASIQFFKMAERESLKDLSWDLVLLDEIHEGGSTELSAEALNTYITNEHSDPIKILMTATYTKPVDYYNVPTECCCFWDLEDVRLMRHWGLRLEKDSIQRLARKYTKKALVDAQQNCFDCGQTNESIRQDYLSSPSLGIMTTTMQQEVYEPLRKATLTGEHVYGFSMKSLLMMTRDGHSFQNEKAVDTFLRLISGSDKLKDYPSGDMSMMSRIRRVWKTRGHRDGESFMTQLWFLPYGVGQLLDDVKRAMVSRIEKNKVLKEYATMTLDSGMKDIAKEVSSRVKEAKESGKEGLIILTGNVGSLGVSLPEVDVAFMMHDIESADMTYQQLMRVLTEDTGKRCGLVVDFNVGRVLSTLNTYATSRCGQTEMSSEERIRWCISHLIDVDPDLWSSSESSQSFSKDALVDRLTKEWRKILETTGTSLLRLARQPLVLGEDQRELDGLARYIAPEKLGNTRIRGDEDSTQEDVQSGIVYRDESNEDDDATADTEEEKEETFVRDLHVNLNEILARLIPELSLLSGCSLDMKQAICLIEENPDMMEALEEFFNETYSRS